MVRCDQPHPRLQGVQRAVRPDRTAGADPARGVTRLRGRGRLRPPPAVAPPRRPRARGAAVARRRRGDDFEHSPRHVRADADDALPPGDRRPGVRDARLPRPRPDLPRRRHRRGDERDADHRRRVPRPQGAADEDGRGDRRDEAALERRARRLRGRVLHAAPRHDLRPARRAGADLRRRLRAARGQARRPRRRRLHLHVGQGPGALREAARRRPRGRRESRAATTSRSSA